ncbi:hypothetical protein EC957_006732 [Mortierella hygrophila]|uniref:Uncharacterized protein n=1 Tax=Mortierella hygrophila TaxID=979708 RepID=A0A9P6JYZ7_9FUNG|nr:hypothetical protein EC957_006732 [Mortierella hygrophila]
MWKTLVGKFQPLPASSYADQNERDLERSWDERDTTGLTGVPDNATSPAELGQLRSAFFACMEAEDDKVRQRAQGNISVNYNYNSSSNSNNNDSNRQQQQQQQQQQQ